MQVADCSLAHDLADDGGTLELLPHTLCRSIHERCLVDNATPNWAATSLLRPRPNRDAQFFYMHRGGRRRPRAAPLSAIFLTTIRSLCSSTGAASPCRACPDTTSTTQPRDSMRTTVTAEPSSAAPTTTAPATLRPTSESNKVRLPPLRRQRLRARRPTCPRGFQRLPRRRPFR